MSEYWELSEYESDAYIDDQHCWLEFNIMVQFPQQKEISNSYYCLEQSKMSEGELNNKNTLLSVVAELSGEAGQYTYQDDFKIDEAYGLTDLSEYILHNDLIDFIKLNLPYLFNSTVLTFVKFCNTDDYFNNELKWEFARCCHNLFIVLNNTKVKEQLEDYISKKYGVANANVEIYYKENGLDYFVCGPDLAEREVWCVSCNRFFPSMNKSINRKSLIEVSKVCLDIDMLMRGCYLFMMGGVKNVAVQFDKGTIKIKAEIYQILTVEGEPIKDYRNVNIDVCGDRKDGCLHITNIKGIEDNAFVNYWMHSGSDVAVYIAILNDEKLKADFKYAKEKWIKEAELKYNIERQDKIIREQQALCEKFLKEQAALKERQEKERMSFSHNIVEEFFKNGQYGDLHVYNEQYGEGIIESLTNSHNMDIIKVKFSSGIEKSFMYPKCFASALTFINKTNYTDAFHRESIKN